VASLSTKKVEKRKRRTSKKKMESTEKKRWGHETWGEETKYLSEAKAGGERDGDEGEKAGTRVSESSVSDSMGERRSAREKEHNQV